MSNRGLYWFVFIVMWAIFIAVIEGCVSPYAICAFPFIMYGFALRCTLRPDWRRK